MKPKFPFRRKKSNDKGLTSIRRIPEDVEDEFLYYYRQHRPQNAYPEDYPRGLIRQSYSFPLPSSASSAPGSFTSDVTTPTMFRDSSSRNSSEYDFGSCYSSLPRRPIPPSISTLPGGGFYRARQLPHSVTLAEDLSGRMQRKLNLLPQHPRDDTQSRDSGHSSTASPDLRGGSASSLRQRRRIQPWFDMGHPFNRQIDESSDYSFCSARCGDVDEDSGVGSVTTTVTDNSRPNMRPFNEVPDHDSISGSTVWTPAEEVSHRETAKQEKVDTPSLGDLAFLHCFRLLWKVLKATLLLMTCIFLVFASLACYEEFNCRQLKAVDVDSLTQKINASVFGQELAVGVVLDAVENLSQGRMTALLLFGWTGTGKSLLVQLVSEAFRSVHKFSIPLHLGDESNHVMLDDLALLLGKGCGPRLVIFEDVDEGTEAAMSKLKAFISTMKDEQVLLLVTMSSGGQAINRSLLDWAKSSSSLKRDRIDQTLVNQIIQDQNVDLPLRSFLHGLKIQSRLVPFLPLTREHVKQCIVKEVIIQGGGAPTREDVRLILDEMEFFSDSFPVFSTAGCKRVAGKVALLLASKDTFLGIA